MAALLSGLASIFKGALRWLGVWAPTNAKILILGLDNAGKTTLMRLLQTGNVTSNLPTGLPYSEELILPGNVNVKAFDMGGQVAARKMWDRYSVAVDGIVYVVDTTDHERFAETRKELQGLLASDKLVDVPVVVLGNKIDMRRAVSEDELRITLGLLHTTGKDVIKGKPDGVRPIEVFMCSIVAKAGVKEGLTWFGKTLAARG